MRLIQGIQVPEAEYWDKITKAWTNERYSDGVLAAHHRKVYLGLITRWVGRGEKKMGAYLALGKPRTLA